MAKAKLSPNEILRIINLLDDWQGALTWEGLAGALPATLGRPFTSQALRRHASIAVAFSRAKSRSQAIRMLMRTDRGAPVSGRFLLGLAGAEGAAQSSAEPRLEKPAPERTLR